MREEFFPSPFVVYHQDVHAASDMRAAPVMRSQSEGRALVRFTREESFPSDPQSAKSGCASRTKDEQSIDFHHPGCVRRIGAHRICELHTECVFDTCPQTGMCTPHRRCELHTGRVCVACIVGARSGPHQPSRLHCAMSLSPPLSSAIQDVYAASKRAAPAMRSHSFSTIQDVYAALDMRATYCDVCSIRLHQPGCVRRIVASYILVVYVSAASSGRHTLTRIA